jgi:hypothetical protein
MTFQLKPTVSVLLQRWSRVAPRDAHCLRPLALVALLDAKDPPTESELAYIADRWDTAVQAADTRAWDALPTVAKTIIEGLRTAIDDIQAARATTTTTTTDA